ncbi:MAG: caspase family protein [Phycisphaerales bacterium]|nr:caspase family protein [Phycisphaerales bacterium]
MVRDHNQNNDTRRQHYVVLLVAFMLVTLDNRSTVRAATDEPALPRKLALLVGINEYRYPLSKLSGCVNDVHEMQRVLRDTYGFAEGDIKTLTDAEATRDNILKAFKQHLIDRASPDTVVVFHYSGHGSYTKDVSGDEGDGRDETLVPFDRSTGGASDITDDTLGELIDALTKKTKKVTIILDCCHSGTATKGATSRHAPPDPRTPPAPRQRERTSGERNTDLAIGSQDCVLLAACRSNESAREYSNENGQRLGAFTYFLSRRLSRSKDNETYRDVMDDVTQQVSSWHPSQNPQIEGAGRDNLFFSGIRRAAEPHVLVDEQNGKIVVRAGAASTMAVGTILDVYPPSTKKFTDRQKIATIEITNVKVARSEARKLRGETIRPASRARIVKQVFKTNPLKVYFEDATEIGVLSEIRSSLESKQPIDATSRHSPVYSEYFELVADRADAQLQVCSNDHGIQIKAADGSVRGAAMPTNDPTTRQTVLKKLYGWAKWHNVLNLRNPNSDIDVRFDVHPVKSKLGGADGRTVEIGEEIEFIVKNHSGGEIYLTILDLLDDGSISVLYPSAGETTPIKSTPQDPWQAKSTVYLPSHKKKSIDNYLLIATREPIQVDFLRQNNLDKAAEMLEAARKAVRKGHDPFQDEFLQLLGRASIGTKNTRPIEASLHNWATARTSITVVRR